MVFLYEGKLNDLDLSIAQRIEKNPSIITNNNIFQAAEYLGISASKLTKYCQKISLKGFKEFKYKIEQELQKRQLYEQNKKSDFHITSIIDPEYQQNLPKISKLFASSFKIIIVSTSKTAPLASYLATKLRLAYHQDTASYTYDHDFSFEYLDNNVITILIDEEQTITSLSASWYRPKQYYVHITNNPLKHHQDYYPLSLSNCQIQLPFDAALILIFNWLIANITKK